jgi:hypothetical protein
MELTAARDAGASESQAVQEKALAILDRAALEGLNAAKPDLKELNIRLAGFVTHQPALGEGYRAFRLGGDEDAYALLANFGVGGPAAVRVYAGAPGQLRLAGRVDRYAQKDFFDAYLELVPIPGPAAVFVTVAGRTDALETGVFTVWHFDGRKLDAVWTSDILQQSSYQEGADGFRLTYCSETDPADPLRCGAMQRDRFIWQDGAWKRVESSKLPATAVAR